MTQEFIDSMKALVDALTEDIKTGEEIRDPKHQDKTVYFRYTKTHEDNKNVMVEITVGIDGRIHMTYDATNVKNHPTHVNKLHNLKRHKYRGWRRAYYSAKNIEGFVEDFKNL